MSDNIKFIEKLRSSALRPTKQRVNICKTLFDRKNTFHFTIYDLHKIMRNKNEEVSLATAKSRVTLPDFFPSHLRVSSVVMIFHLLFYLQHCLA